MLAPVRIQDHFPVAPEKQSEEVIVAYYQDLGGTPPTLTLASGVWSDLDRLEFNGGYTDSAFVSGHDVLTSKDLKDNPTDWKVIVRNGNPSSDSYLLIQATSATTASVSYGASPSALKSVIGYRTRYVTETKQVIIPVTPEYVSSGSFVNTNEVTVNQRYTIDANKLPSDFRNADGTIKSSVKAIVQLEITGSDRTGWVSLPTGEMYDSAASGFRYYGASYERFSDSLAVITSGYGGRNNAADASRLVWVWNSLAVGTHSDINAAPCQLIVWNDEKYATSIPVADKGYGGMKSTVPQDESGTISATPVAVEFDALAFSIPSLNVTEDLLNNQVSLGKVGIWSPDLILNLQTDSSANERIVTVDIYDVDENTPVKSKEFSIVKNQTKHPIDFDRNFFAELANKPFKIRIAATVGTFSTFIISDAELTITLYTPL